MSSVEASLSKQIDNQNTNICHPFLFDDKYKKNSNHILAIDATFQNGKIHGILEECDYIQILSMQLVRDVIFEAFKNYEMPIDYDNRLGMHIYLNFDNPKLFKSPVEFIVSLRKRALDVAEKMNIDYTGQSLLDTFAILKIPKHEDLLEELSQLKTLVCEEKTLHFDSDEELFEWAEPRLFKECKDLKNEVDINSIVADQNLTCQVLRYWNKFCKRDNVEFPKDLIYYQYVVKSN